MALRDDAGWEDLEDVINVHSTIFTSSSAGLANGIVSSAEIHAFSVAEHNRRLQHGLNELTPAEHDLRIIRNKVGSMGITDDHVNGGDGVDGPARDENDDDDYADEHDDEATGEEETSFSTPPAERQRRFRAILDNMPDDEPVYSNADDVETPDSANEIDQLSAKTEVPFLLQPLLTADKNKDDYILQQGDTTTNTSAKRSARQRKRSTASGAPDHNSNSSNEDEQHHAPLHLKEQHVAVTSTVNNKRRDQRNESTVISRRKPTEDRRSPTTSEVSRRLSTASTVTDDKRSRRADLQNNAGSSRRQQHRHSPKESTKATRGGDSEEGDNRRQVKDKHKAVDRHQRSQHSRRSPLDPKHAASRRHNTTRPSRIDSATTSASDNNRDDFDYEDDDDADVENDTFTNTYFTETAQSERYTTTSVATDKTMTLPYAPQHYMLPGAVARTPFGQPTFMPYGVAPNASMYYQPQNYNPYNNMMAMQQSMLYNTSPMYYGQQHMMDPRSAAWMMTARQHHSNAAGGPVPFMMQPYGSMEGQQSNTSSLSRRQLAADAAAGKPKRPTTLEFEQQQMRNAHTVAGPSANRTHLEQQPATTLQTEERDELPTELTATKPGEPSAAGKPHFFMPHAVGAFIGDHAAMVLEFQRKFPGDLNYIIMPLSAAAVVHAGDSYSGPLLDARMAEILRHYPGNLPLLALLRHEQYSSMGGTARRTSQHAYYSDSISAMPVEKQAFALCDKLFDFFSKSPSSAFGGNNRAVQQQNSKSDECLLWELLMLLCQPLESQRMSLMDVMLEKLIRSYVLTGSNNNADKRIENESENDDDDGTSAESSYDDDDVHSGSTGSKSMIDELKVRLLQGDRAGAFEASLGAIRRANNNTNEAIDNNKTDQQSSSDVVVHSVLLGAIVDNGHISGSCLVRLARVLYNTHATSHSAGSALSTVYKAFTFDEPVVAIESAMLHDARAWREHVFSLMACCMLHRSSSTAGSSASDPVVRQTHTAFANSEEANERILRQRVAHFLVQMSDKLLERAAYAGSDVCLLLGCMLCATEAVTDATSRQAVADTRYFLTRLVRNINARLARDLREQYEQQEAQKLHGGGGKSSANSSSASSISDSQFVIDYCTLQVVSYLMARDSLIIPSVKGLTAIQRGSSASAHAALETLDAHVGTLVNLDYEFHMVKLIMHSSTSSAAVYVPVLCRMLTVLLNWKPHFADLVVDAVVGDDDLSSTTPTKSSQTTDGARWWADQGRLQRFLERCLLLLTSTRHKTLQYQVLELLHAVLSETTGAVAADIADVEEHALIGPPVTAAVLQAAKPAAAVEKSNLQRQVAASLPSPPASKTATKQPPAQTPLRETGHQQRDVQKQAAPLPAASSRQQQTQQLAKQQQQQQQYQAEHQRRASAGEPKAVGAELSVASSLAVAARPLVGGAGGAPLQRHSPGLLSRQQTLPPISEDISGSLPSPITPPTVVVTAEPRMRPVFTVPRPSSGAYGGTEPLSDVASSSSRLPSASASTTTLVSGESTASSGGSYIYPGQRLDGQQHTGTNNAPSTAAPLQPASHEPLHHQQQHHQQHRENDADNTAAMPVVDSYSDFGCSIPYTGGGDDDNNNSTTQYVQQLAAQQPLMPNGPPAAAAFGGGGSAVPNLTAYGAPPGMQYGGMPSTAAAVNNNNFSRSTVVGAHQHQQQHNRNVMTNNNQNLDMSSQTQQPYSNISDRALPNGGVGSGRAYYGYNEDHSNTVNNAHGNFSNAEAGGGGEEYDDDRHTFDDDEEDYVDEDEVTGSSQSPAESVVQHHQQQQQQQDFGGSNSFVHFPDAQQPVGQFVQPQPQYYPQQQPPVAQQQFNPTMQSTHMPYAHQQSVPANFYSQQQPFAQPKLGTASGSSSEYASAFSGSSGNEGAVSTNAKNTNGVGTNASSADALPATSNDNNNDAAAKKGGGRGGGFLRSLSSWVPQRLVGGGGGGGGTGNLDTGSSSKAAATKVPKKMILPSDKNPTFVYENGLWINKKDPQAHLAAVAPAPPPPAAAMTRTFSQAPVGGLSDFYRLGHPASTPNLQAMGAGGTGGGGGLAPPVFGLGMPSMAGPPI